MSKKEQSRQWIIGEVTVNGTKIPIVDTKLISADRLGSYKARWGIGRMRYIVEPGLYAAGKPSAGSPVFVSANYKMSFDRLRSQLKGIDGWILVLDTKGINVWCAAGKGTFGTDELIRRIRAVNLTDVISHRKLILPQLGAPGVSAHKVREVSGFMVKYGPVRAEDIPAYLNAGRNATAKMRQVNFGFTDRAVLIPNELIQSAKYFLPAAACFFLLSGVGADIYSAERMIRYGLFSAAIFSAAYVIGITLPPLLLPWLPGKAFSVKGASVGLILAVAVGLYFIYNPESYRNVFGAAAWLFIIPAATSFTAMNFTGCSTYTSPSGVRREMRAAVPIQIVLATVGAGLWITGLFA